MLPCELVELLRTQNGGFINYNILPLNTPNLWGESEVEIDLIPGISAEEHQFYGLKCFKIDWTFGPGSDEQRMREMMKRVGRPDLIIPLDRDAHCFVALDYRPRPFHDDPPVIWMSTDDDCDYVEIAPNFRALLNRLEKSDASSL